jgi:hypothetical protein
MQERNTKRRNIMSLSEAVMMIIEEMDRDAHEWEKGDGGDLCLDQLIRSYAKQLRAAVKASEGSFLLISNGHREQVPVHSVHNGSEAR